ncbi:MAG: hypothetical protein V4805_07055 [Pseudomonadota bacterium]
MLLLKSFLVWLLILCLAIANGALRELVLIPHLGKSSGLMLSGALLSSLVALVAYVFVRRQHSVTLTQGLGIGVLWLCLTLVFECGFGRYVQHKSWAELLDAYTFKDGNVWPVVLLVTLLAPYLTTLLCAKRQHAKSEV